MSDHTPDTPPPRGLTVSDVARRYRIGEDKVRSFIRRGELAALNTAATLCGRPRYVVTPEALERFERGRQAATQPKPAQRRKRQRGAIDFYAD